MDQPLLNHSSCPNQQTQSFLGYNFLSPPSMLNFRHPTTQASTSATTLALGNTSKALGISSAELSSAATVPSSSTLGFAGFASSVTPPFRSLSTSSKFGTILKPPDSESAPSLSAANTSRPLAESSGTSISSNTYLSTSAFGAPQNPIGFGTSSLFGQTNSASLGTTFGGKKSPSGDTLMFPKATTSQILSSRDTPAMSSTSTPFGGSSTLVVGSSHTPAFGSALSPTLCKAGAPIGVPSACPFGSSSTSFTIPSTFGPAQSPVLHNSSTACGSVFASSNIPAFGSATTSACTQFPVTSAPLVGTTQMASGPGSQQPLFNELCWGSRLAAYTPTEEISDYNNAHDSGMLLSISAMRAYNGKCHEELRWEDYRMGLASSLVKDQIFHAASLTIAMDQPLLNHSSCPNQQTQSFLGYNFLSPPSITTQASTSATTLALGNTSKALGISSAELSSAATVPSSSTLGFAGFASSVTPPFRSLSTSSKFGTILKPPDSESAPSLSAGNTSRPLAESSGTSISSNTYLSTSAFGAPQNPIGFGSSSLFGQTNSASLGTTFGGKKSPSGDTLMFPKATTSQILSSRVTPAMSSTSTPFGGSSTLVVGSSHTPAFGSALSPTLCKAGAPIGVPSACPFGSSSTSFTIPSTFGPAQSPVLHNSSTACGSVFASSNIPAFGSATTSACTQFPVTSAPLGTTQMASGPGSQQPLFNELCWGSRLAAYTPTEEISDYNNAHDSGMLLSISAMRAYNGKCHEELRWEDYRMGLASSLVKDQIFHAGTRSSGGITGLQQCRGSRVAGYTKTAEIDCEKIESVSAMCAFGNRSHEELRWEDYRSGDKGRTASTQLAGPFQSITYPHEQTSSTTTELGRNMLISISSTPSIRLDGCLPSSIATPAQSAQTSGTSSFLNLAEKPVETVNIVMSPDGIVKIVTSTLNIQFSQTSLSQASGDFAYMTNLGTAENISTQSSQMAQEVPFANASTASLTQQNFSIPDPIMQQGISKMTVPIVNDDDELHGIPEVNAPSSIVKDNALLRDTHIPLDRTEKPAESSIYHETSVEASTEILMPKLSLADYYTEPPIHELATKERAEPGFCKRVKDFVIGRCGYGSIKLIGETDIVGLDLECFVRFNNREILLYTSDNSKSRISGPAEVTLLNVTCSDKKAGECYVGGPKVEKYEKMLVRKAREVGAEHMSYDSYTGEWKFRVEDLNKYNKG